MNGEYNNPAQRVSKIEFPAVSGYTTARMRTRFQGDNQILNGTMSQTAWLTQIQFENLSDSSLTLQLIQTESGGPRTNLGSAVTLVGQGTKTVDYSPTKKYIEVSCTSGNGQVRMNIASRLRWEIMAFDDWNDIGRFPNTIVEAEDQTSFDNLR